jgi:hypothetical protein
MRYKDLVTRKLEQLDDSLHQLNQLININDQRGAKQFIDSIKEKIGDIQTLINTEE